MGVMQNKVSIIGNFLIVNIDKPIYVNDEISGVAINQKYFEDAIRRRKYLVVRTPTGEVTIMPKQYIKNNKTFNKVYLFPDKPMKMYQVKVPHKEHRPHEFYEVMG